MRGGVSLNVALYEHHPEIIAACAGNDWEFCSRGGCSTRYLLGMGEAQERAVIQHSIDTIRKRTGQRLDGWLSPAQSESSATLGLLAAAGVDHGYDWLNGDMPYPMRTPGRFVHAMPRPVDIDDNAILAQNHHTEDDFSDQLCNQFDFLYRESATQGGRVTAVSLHPGVIGQPYRIQALEDALEHMMRHRGVWAATGGEILDAWTAAQA